MSEKDIVDAWIKDCMKRRKSTLVFPNVFVDLFEADILEITKSGYAHELEVKLSRSDFKADMDKSRLSWTKEPEWTRRKRVRVNKHEQLRGGDRVNTFTYIVPKGLMSEKEVPQKAGLIYAIVRQYNGKAWITFETIRKAQSLSKEKHGLRIQIKCLLSTYYRYHEQRKKNKL